MSGSLFLHEFRQENNAQQRAENPVLSAGLGEDWPSPLLAGSPGQRL